ncbi:MAG: hypothetical protein DHS20C17_28870 [Cyclobacteriaceae bacterium]|nr:MAG: hypothetical protein DHS20C17_28870 [Cyclobacteriaceae bacterium]
MLNNAFKKWFYTLARTSLLGLPMHKTMRKPSGHTLKNLTLWIGILTAIFLVTGTFFNTIEFSGDLGIYQLNASMEQFKSVTRILIEAFQPVEL